MGQTLVSSEIIESGDYKKRIGNVRTADGQRQQCYGTVILEIGYNGQIKSIEFLLIPSIMQDIISGMNFWEKFDRKIVTLDAID